MKFQISERPKSDGSTSKIEVTKEKVYKVQIGEVSEEVEQ